MATTTAVDLIQSVAMKLGKGPLRRSSSRTARAGSARSHVRRMPPCRTSCPSSEDIRGYMTVVAQAEM